MKYFIIFLLVCCSVYFGSCVGKPKSTRQYPEKIETDVSATQVVNTFLEDLKNRDFGRAYDHIYVSSYDREGYIIRVSSVWQEFGLLRLIGYKILGTHLFKDTAIVVAELHEEIDVGGGVEKRVRRNKYDLKVFDSEWKITKDSCIENCS